MLYAKKIAQGKGVIIPDEAKANSAAMSAWIDSNRGTKRRKCGRKDVAVLAAVLAPIFEEQAGAAIWCPYSKLRKPKKSWSFSDIQSFE